MYHASGILTAIFMQIYATLWEVQNKMCV